MKRNNVTEQLKLTVYIYIYLFQEDFCDYVEKRYNLVHGQDNPDAGNAFMEEIAEVVQQLVATPFFQQATPPQPSANV